MITKDYYSVLGVKYGASTQEIRKAYKEKCKALHPDVNDDPDATRIMQEVNEAYRVLSDKYLRFKYDEEYTSTSKGGDSCWSDENVYYDPHSDTDSYVYSNWHRYSNPDTWYEKESDKSGGIPWWIIVLASLFFAKLLNDII